MAIYDPGVLKKSKCFAIEEGLLPRSGFPYHIVDVRTSKVIASFYNYRLAEWVLTMVSTGTVSESLSDPRGLI